MMFYSVKGTKRKKYFSFFMEAYCYTSIYLISLTCALSLKMIHVSIFLWLSILMDLILATTMSYFKGMVTDTLQVFAKVIAKFTQSKMIFWKNAGRKVHTLREQC